MEKIHGIGGSFIVDENAWENAPVELLQLKEASENVAHAMTEAHGESVFSAIYCAKDKTIIFANRRGMEVCRLFVEGKKNYRLLARIDQRYADQTDDSFDRYRTFFRNGFDYPVEFL